MGVNWKKVLSFSRRNWMPLAIISTFMLYSFRCHASNPGSPDTLKVGIYVASIYDLNYQNGSFSSVFWMWRVNTKREFKEHYKFEFKNAKDFKELFNSNSFHDQTENMIVGTNGDTLYWDYDEFSATFRHEFDVRNYPFDEENLVMEFEGLTYYDDWVKLQIDRKQSACGNLKIDGWQILDMKIDTFRTTYPTNFGSPGDIGGHAYSGFRVTLPIKREGWSLFFKLFAGLLVAFIIALFSLKINLSEADGRFGVCVGA